MDSNAFQLHLATAPVVQGFAFTIDDILRDGARRALQAAIEREVEDYIQRNAACLDDQGRRLVVRNGHHPARKIQSGNGPIEVKQPRVNDRRTDEQGNRIRFSSKILPPYLRKTKAIEELVPWLYLKGISTSDFPEALACLGHDGSGLSATNVVRMKELWQGEYENFCRRPLIGKRYVYLWADGIYFNIRLTDDRPCVLVLMGATEDGTSNPIESTFATVRLRTSKTKGAGSRTACLAMAFKLVESAQNHWRKLNGSVLLPEVIAGVIFKDGTKLAA